MGLWNWIKTLLSGRPHFVISRHDGPYLLRWWLIPRNKWFNIYLHKFCGDDDDRALHDHPWSSLSILLRGSYIEHTDGPESAPGSGDRQRVYKRGSVIYRRPDYRHRIVLIENQPAWTLFITGPQVRIWGFWCPKGFVPWFEFVDARDSGEVGKGCD